MNYPPRHYLLTGTYPMPRLSCDPIPLSLPRLRVLSKGLTFCRPHLALDPQQIQQELTRVSRLELPVPFRQRDHISSIRRLLVDQYWGIVQVLSFSGTSRTCHTWDAPLPRALKLVGNAKAAIRRYVLEPGVMTASKIVTNIANSAMTGPLVNDVRSLPGPRPFLAIAARFPIRLQNCHFPVTCL